MQTFIDTATGKLWAFEDDVSALAEAGAYSFAGPDGTALDVPATLTPYAPAPAELLADAKTAQTAVVMNACGVAILAGFTSSALGAPHQYPSRMTDQQNLGASVISSLMPGVSPDWTTPFWCADADGTWSYAAHTAAQIQQVGQDGKAAILALMQRKADLAAAIEAAATVEAVQSVQWDT